MFFDILSSLYDTDVSYVFGFNELSDATSIFIYSHQVKY